jgi:hypothetical protein
MHYVTGTVKTCKSLKDSINQTIKKLMKVKNYKAMFAPWNLTYQKPSIK